MGIEVALRNVSQGLAEDRFERPFIDLVMQRDRERLAATGEKLPTDLDVAYLPGRLFSKPNFAKILRTSCPERVLSFGMDEGFEFEGGEHRRIVRQIEIRKILAPTVKADRLSQALG